MLEYVGVANGIIALAGKACGAISKVVHLGFLGKRLKT